MDALELARTHKAIAKIKEDDSPCILSFDLGVHVSHADIYWLYANVPDIMVRDFEDGNFEHFGFRYGVRFYLVSRKQTYPGLPHKTTSDFDDCQ